MIKFADFTAEERETVTAIAQRAVNIKIYRRQQDAEMDLSATHARLPLRLTDLLNANTFNFSHDMSGIQRHMDRRTGRLDPTFLPRFARPVPTERPTALVDDTGVHYHVTLDATERDDLLGRRLIVRCNACTDDPEISTEYYDGAVIYHPTDDHSFACLGLDGSEPHCMCYEATQ